MAKGNHRPGGDHSRRSGKNQARHVAMKLADHSTARHGGGKDTGTVKSLGSERVLKSDLKGVATWAAARGESLTSMMPALAVEYLLHRAEAVRGSQLSSDRQSLDKLLALSGHTGKLPHIRSELPEITRNKHYSAAQVNAIIEHQRPANALATRIVAESGIRAHELHTLRLINTNDRAVPSCHRQFRTDLHAGRELAGGSLVEYVTTGKGGLSRSIMLSFETSKLLERHRLVEPVYIKDRGVRYEKSYSPAGVSGGAAWSTSFSRASVAALGWSCGGHSLRHTFVENRMITLTEQLNYEYHDAKLLISQELGHFREDILIYYGYP